MAETELHLWVMMDLIQTIAQHFAADPMTYVGGDLLLLYEEGNPWKHVAPDVFVVRGVPKLPPRDNYMMWEEGRGPDLVIEVTSKTTRENDETKKQVLYRDIIRIPEYFLFDPTEDYLRPSLQGFRLRRGEYRPIRRAAGRLPSEVLGLHLERSGTSLRLFDPTIGRWLLTPREQAIAAQQQAIAAQQQAIAAQERAIAAQERAETAEAEADRLRREVEELPRRLGERG